MTGKLIDTDHRVLTKIKGGDRKALNQLFEKYYDPLYHFAHGICKNSSISDEAVADVFITIWLNRHKLKISSTRAYLFTVTKNNVLQALKKNPATFSWDETKDNREATVLTDEKAENRQLNQARNILDKMPPQCRLIFEMHKLQHFKYAQIAKILKISVKTVENQMGKALKIIHQSVNNTTKKPLNTNKTNT